MKRTLGAPSMTDTRFKKKMQGWGIFVRLVRFIQKGEKTDLVAEIGRFFKQNIYFMAVFCLQWTKISNT